MTATRYPLHTPAPITLWRAGKGACRVFAHALRRCADAWQRHRQTRAALRELSNLSAMDDRLLRDVGIDRSGLLSLSLALHSDDALRRRFKRRR